MIRPSPRNDPFYTSSEIRNHMEKYHRDHELEASHIDIIKQDMCVVRCNNCNKWLITHSIGQVGRPVFSGLNSFQQHYNNHLCSSAVESVSNGVSVVVNTRLGKRRPLSPKALVGVYTTHRNTNGLELLLVLVHFEEKLFKNKVQEEEEVLVQPTMLLVQIKVLVEPLLLVQMLQLLTSHRPL